MKQQKGLILGIATGLLLAVSFGNANAEHIRSNNGTAAGTSLGTRIDLNDDDVPANWSTAEVSGTLGKRTGQGVVEVVFNGVTPECPSGVFIVDKQNGIGFGSNTGTFPNGDQLYSQLLTRTQCGLG